MSITTLRSRYSNRHESEEFFIDGASQFREEYENPLTDPTVIVAVDEAELTNDTE